MKVFISNVNTSATFKIGSVMDNIKEKIVKIQSFEWFNLLKNVSSTKTLRFRENGVDYLVNISEGNYTADELADEIKAKMNTAIGASRFTVTYNSKSFKFDFSNSLNNFTIYADSGIGPLIGFNVNSASAQNASSDSVADLSPIDFIYVICSLVNDATYKEARRGILWKIQVNKGPGEMIYYSSNSIDDWSDIYNQSNEITVELRDRDMNLIPSTGINWNMFLLFR